jgi:hypothetical protein
MSHARHVQVKRIDSNRAYLLFNPTGWKWHTRTFSADFKLNYDKLPHGNTNQLVAIEDLRGGRDGRVWLTMDKDGAVAVIKFSNDKSSLGATRLQVIF